MTLDPDDGHFDDDDHDDHDPIVLALREYGRAMLPPDFESSMPTFDELMANVNARLAADTLSSDEHRRPGLGTANVRSCRRPPRRAPGRRRRR